jgi:hypothetical protein
MNTTQENALTQDLRRHLALCKEVMALVAREHEELSNQGGYNSFEFYQQRKNLLPRLEESLMALRKWRNCRRQAGPTEPVEGSELKALFESVQALLMKVLLLDRENQQALLRHGLVPARHLPSSAAQQQPHCVADLYRRHSRC